MNDYKWLGIFSLGLLLTAMGLTIYVLIGRHSRRKVYMLAGTVVVITLVVSGLCWVIYSKYHI